LFGKEFFNGDSPGRVGFGYGGNLQANIFQSSLPCLFRLLEWNVNLIQSELSKLNSIGVVTVSPQSPVPDGSGQCVWEVTFESKAGNVPSIKVAKSGTNRFSNSATMNSGDRIVVTDDTVRGTSIPVSG
jgi:hypothetical protein